MASKALANTDAFTQYNQVSLIRSGKQYFDKLVQLIDDAKIIIHIQSYIFDDDETGNRVADALKNAAKRKVDVYLMADGYASQVMSQSFIDDMREAGIQFRFFEPLFKSKYFYFGRRMHHKIAVFDSKCALIGGVNIANRYNDLPGEPAWLDFALYTEGEIAKEICLLCWKSWKGYPKKMQQQACEKETIQFTLSPENLSAVRMRENDWVRRKNEISQTYVQMIDHAQSYVLIFCSYFLPDINLRKKMSQAVKRGVNIRVITAGRSDVILTKPAERWLYDWLLRNGIELHEYQTNILHSKLAICDDEWMTIGSYNINSISTYASIELNVDVVNPDFVKKVRQKLESIIADECMCVSAEVHAKTNNVFKQFTRWFSYQFIRMVIFLFTFYFKQRN